MNSQNNARKVIERLTATEIDELVPEEELFQELYAEGIDADEVVAGVRAAMQRIDGKVRILGVPVNDNSQGGDA
jgi:hypothetical protein